jgi:hypothetical protein
MRRECSIQVDWPAMSSTAMVVRDGSQEGSDEGCHVSRGGSQIRVGSKTGKT